MAKVVIVVALLFIVIPVIIQNLGVVQLFGSVVILCIVGFYLWMANDNEEDDGDGPFQDLL